MRWTWLVVVMGSGAAACQQVEGAALDYTEKMPGETWALCPQSRSNALERGEWVKVLENTSRYPIHPVCIVGPD